MPPTPYPPYVIRSCQFSEMSNEVQDIPPYTPYVIRSCELSVMSNDEQDTTPPTLPILCH